MAALVEYRIALSLQPEWVPVKESIGRVQGMLAKELAQQKVEQETAKKEAQTEIAKANQNAEARHMEDQTKAASHEADTLKKQVNAAKRYVNEGSYKKALTVLKMTLELDPDYQAAHELQAKTAEILSGKQKELYRQAAEARRKGDKESEKGLWQRAMILDPDDALAVREYQKLLQEMLVPVENVSDKENPDQNELIQKQKKRLQW